jgi:hypothetical protein
MEALHIAYFSIAQDLFHNITIWFWRKRVIVSSEQRRPVSKIHINTHALAKEVSQIVLLIN